MIKNWIRKWLGLSPMETKVEKYIPESQKNPVDQVLRESVEGGVIAIQWYDHDKKTWKMQKITRAALEDIKPVAVAVWDIKQFVTCPFCNWRTDVIASNLRRKVNQGRDNGKDIHIVKRADGSSYTEKRETVMDIPTPPYFGALMEDTEGMEEHIPCESCGRDLQVQEAHWGYGENAMDCD